MESPSVVVALDRATDNIRRAMDRFGTASHAPHHKAHKLASIARIQRDFGAKAVTVHKLSEAESYAEVGFRSFRIAHPIWPPAKRQRVSQLLDLGCELTIHVDSVEAVQQWAGLGKVGDQTVDVLIDLDVGFHRGGVSFDDSEQLVRVHQAVASCPWMNFVGVAGYRGIFVAETDGRSLASLAVEEAGRLSTARTLLEQVGIRVDTVAGGPSALMFDMAQLGVNEIRGGAYSLGDLMSVHLGLTRREDVAIRFVATVVSRSVHGCYVLDAGAKTFGWDYGVFNHGLDRLAESESGDVRIISAGDEHSIAESSIPLHLGEKLVLIPTHGARTMNLHDRVWVSFGDEVTGHEKVVARARSL